MAGALLQKIKPLIERGDIQCDPGDRCPHWLEVHLNRIGGRNMYNEPFFRIARAETVMRKLAFDFPIWRETDDVNQRIPIKEAVKMIKAGVSATEVHEFVTQTAENMRPQTVERGYRWERKYPCDGIVIEKWNSVNLYGSPLDWEQQKIMGYSFCGPFPYHGDYEMIGSDEPRPGDKKKLPWPTKDRLTLLIQQYYKVLHTQPENPKTRTMLRIAEFEQREKARFQHLAKDIDAEVRDDIKGICKSVSLEAGRLREAMAKEMGHHDWGHVGN